jgi:hypothetical protein
MAKVKYLDQIAMNGKIVMKTLLTLTILFIFASCRPKGANVESKNGNAETIDSKAQEIERKGREYLQPLLHVGESPADLVRRFGNPVDKHVISSNEVCLSFSFSDRNQAAENAGVGGFDAFFVSNRLSHWRPSYRDPAFSASPPGHPLFTSDKELFKLFVETDSLKNSLEALDSKGSADASDLKVPPDLVFEAKVIVGNYTSQTKTNKMMFLTINDQDVPKMENLTKNNVGKRMLIVCRGEVISAPVIMMPIASNKFQFQVQDSGFLDRLKK